MAPGVITVVCTFYYKALFQASCNLWVQLPELSHSEPSGCTRYTYVHVALLFRYRRKVKRVSCSGQRGLEWRFGLCSQELWGKREKWSFWRGSLFDLPSANPATVSSNRERPLTVCSSRMLNRNLHNFSSYPPWWFCLPWAYPSPNLR